MEKIVIKTGIDISTGLETQVEFSNITLGNYNFPGNISNLNITVEKQYLKKDGKTIHNKEFIQLGITSEDNEETKLAKEMFINAFETAIKTSLINLIKGLV